MDGHDIWDSYVTIQLLQEKKKIPDVCYETQESIAN